MRITPLDIRNQKFGRRLSGISPDEVESFLALVSEDYEALVRDSEGQAERTRYLELRVEQLVADERLLKETLLSAQAMTSEMREAATKEAEVLVGEAEVRAEKILDAAHRRAAKIGEEIREMRGIRTRLAEALRTTLDAHRAYVDSIEEANQEDEALAEVTYLARNAQAQHASRENDAGENSLG
ncbi:MAG: DivIVA domain-containing protein [Myxococcota bacterium]|nr:DivIVA domain-containing protein [Myxococcota bacterium]